jgi:hypothetical protein
MFSIYYAMILAKIFLPTPGWFLPIMYFRGAVGSSAAIPRDEVARNKKMSRYKRTSDAHCAYIFADTISGVVAEQSPSK